MIYFIQTEGKDIAVDKSRADEVETFLSLCRAEEEIKTLRYHLNHYYEELCHTRNELYHTQQDLRLTKQELDDLWKQCQEIEQERKLLLHRANNLFSKFSLVILR